MRKSFFALTGAAILAAIVFALEGDRSSHQSFVATEIRAVTFESRNQPPQTDIDQLAALGASHVALIPFGFQRTPSSTEIRFNPEARWYTESDEGIRTVAAWAQQAGLGVIVKPHIWIGRYSSDGQTRDKVLFDSDFLWDEWEESYREFILHYAALSDEVGADVFIVGTELAGVARTRPEFWRSIIKDVRTVFSGQLTYAANWWEEYEHVEFWDDLDFIGVQAYFPIYEGGNKPNRQILVDGWNAHKASLEKIAEEFDRRVLFTEIGYRSVDYAAARPWVWASRETAAAEIVDEELQSELYAAFFDALWGVDWFGGALLWKWQSSLERRSNPTDFTPQDKLAEDTIREYFTRYR